MSKKELVNMIAEKIPELKKKDIKAVVDAVFESISDALAKGEKVQLIGFGTFEVRKAEERTGVNPRTREKIKIPARKVPKFKPGKELKEKVNK
ncbi:DNA-binding protein HU 1 [Thermosipho africanus H17ap60334]|jgi:DNA-binding protein HU-beta|uniref:DNA-binding protein HU-beta n=2 Tax=Thermosipho TaxID=2420 RepID=A0A841GJY6_9BACT|nr:MULTISPECIES: HU family DNA-binding protein [Thermosipho]DAB34708.1 MAG TPA: HU family DNA-binding protein [Sulfurospirillum sp. UBA12182]ACJ75190.1 DNA-binding protein HU 1 [Thermosipho africanus TCF52B]EKF48494.1 DNA-binding protein HU 1 [Thermosipho africanus H17ap60334]MBB6062677.1 DNA-binding protein HU-beta [Thermosipho japonicus]MBZ4650383.1 DNA-binding protein 1 [Thermosipho sp. (in: thermotogales)]